MVFTVRAGDLNPPAGPITPTHKTLTEVEPRIAINATNTPGDANSLFKITQRGSYYLTGNIIGVAAKHGIEIVASGVTIDFDGYEIQGIAGSLDGVSVTVVGLTNIAVVNGSIRSWGGDGVDLRTANATNCRVADMLANGNAGNGISTGFDSTISDCSAYLNNLAGISTVIGCSITNCSAYQNTGNGISTSSGCTVSDCTTVGNAGTGIDTSTACTITNCLAHANDFDGISTGSTCTISYCSVVSNAGHGVSAGAGNTILNCSAGSNTGSGISAGNDCMVANCSTSFNTDSGISVTTGSMVIDCTAHANTFDGVVCTIHCVIRGNNCSFNGIGNGAGIHATGVGNRIEGNNCTQADRGIDVDAAGNIIIKNTCSANGTNWDIIVGNAVAPIIQATTNAAAISGNTYAGTLGSTDPNANFTY